MTEKVRRGPKYKIQDSDWPKIEAACKIHCTREEICAMFGVEQDTLEAAIRRKYGYRKFSSFWKAKSAGGKMSVRRAQYHKGVNEMNTSMLIWLGKNWLKQSDKARVDLTSSDGSMSPAGLTDAIIAALSRKHSGGVGEPDASTDVADGYLADDGEDNGYPD